MTSRCKPVISLTIRLKICFASLWSSLRVRLKRETIGEWEIKGEDFKPHITNREQNHRTTPGQWTPRQDGKTDMPDETHAWLLYQGKQAQEPHHTEMLPGQLLGLPWSHGNNNKDENPWNYNYKRKLSPRLIHWTCWVRLDVSLGWNTRWRYYSPCTSDGGHG